MATNLSRQRRFWSRRAVSWDHHAAHNPGLVQVVERVVVKDADPRATDIAVDLGCGSGQLALRLAPVVSSVIAIDISQQMIDLLTEHATEAMLTNIEGLASPIEQIELAPGSVDVVVSSYALHHLRDRDKAVLVAHVARWLRPGGRFVVGDMMFGRGADSTDRSIISAKLRLLARRGPGGWWRIAKNAFRYLARYQERPVAMSRWITMFDAAGFTDVHGDRIVSEAAVVRGRIPAEPRT